LSCGGYVFAVFARADLAKAFATSWSEKSNIALIADPYYAAVLATATCSSVNLATQPLPSDDASYLCRAAELKDIVETAEFCKVFADDSIIYLMSIDAARAEAEGYIRDSSLYVCEIETGGVRRIASVVAVTRNAHPYAFVTKVFTAPGFRGKGIAQRLVRWTCDHYLTTLGYEYVSLYVDLANIPAAKTYKNVGFHPIHLSANESADDITEEWIEIGFDTAKTDLGFW
jgi:predicted GNAT family acetyltransferase